MRTFQEWMNEITKTVLDYLPDHEPDPTKPTDDKAWGKSTDRKDPGKFPILDRPQFRKTDAVQIRKDAPEVETWLDAATSKFGVHWVLMYLPPEPGTQSIDDPESQNAAVSVAAAKRLGAPGWNKYKAYSQTTAQSELDKFIAEYQAKGADLKNTIVYIKPTSRVHTLKGWLVCHNIAHGVWGYAKKQSGGKLYKDFVQALQKVIYEVQQKHYEQPGPDGQPPKMPNAQEMVIMLGRVLGLGASFRKIFMASDGDLGVPGGKSASPKNSGRGEFKIHTAFNSFDEAMFDLLALYLNNSGKWSIKTTGEIPKTSYKDRGADLTPHPEIQKAYQPRDFVWKKLASDTPTWLSALETHLEPVLGQAFQACTWGNLGTPIYATTGYLTTGA